MFAKVRTIFITKYHFLSIPRKHDLFFSIEDKIVQLMELDSKDAIKLFLEHSDKLGPELIVEKLKVSTR